MLRYYEETAALASWPAAGLSWTRTCTHGPSCPRSGERAGWWRPCFAQGTWLSARRRGLAGRVQGSRELVGS